MSLDVQFTSIIIKITKENLMKKLMMVIFLDTQLFPRPLESSTLEENKLKETYHITFDESPNAIKFLGPLVDNINIAKAERYPSDEYLHPYKPSKRYQTNSNDVSFIEPYECPKPVILETKVSSDQNGQADPNDQSAQTDEILNDDMSKHSNHTNDKKIIDNLPNTKDIWILKHLSSPDEKDTSLQNTILILNPSLSIPSMSWNAHKRNGKELSAALAHECLFVDFLSEEEPKKIKQSERGISINQEKYVKDLLKKYNINGSLVKTPMVPPNNLGPDLSDKAVNETQYRGFDLRGYSDSNYIGCNMDRSLTQYKEYLCKLWYTAKTLDESKIWVSTPIGGIRGDIGINTFRNALRARYLPHLSMYVSTSSVTIVRPWFATIGYSGEIKANGTLKKSCLPPRVKLDYAMQIWEDIIHKLIKKTREKVVPYPSQSEKETQFSLAKDKSPSHSSPPIPVVAEMHKEAQQATSGPTSLGATSKEGAHPQLSSGTNLSVVVDQTKSASDGLKIAHTDSGINEESRADDISKKIKLEDLFDLLKDIRSTFFTLDSPQDEIIIVSYESKDEKEVAKDKDTHASSHDSFILGCLTEEYSMGTSSRVSSLPSQVSLVQEKLKTLDSLPSILNKDTDTLNIFATVVKNASRATTKGVPSTGQATNSPIEGEKNTNPAIIDAEPNLHEELVDLLSIDVVTQYYNQKLLYDKYCDKMLKRRKSSKITNCDVLTQKGLISLKVHKEDRTSEVISNIKVSDLHLAK
uniref:Retrovirus-related Pol polyprotein from transposon TNT 1-94 n=1 Tax=Tanacetum cinerariifolium TaxID=118510 RepID=A0A699GQ50_TANCI|nr:retrovirus-related Pol polyprotein from transposon TNT 1-94 [Tanacetum cinerariifolium]